MALDDFFITQNGNLLSINIFVDISQIVARFAVDVPRLI